MCGNLTVMRQTELRIVTKFRACKACIEAHTQVTRKRWVKGPSS
jgi:AhpD family alkylhydroperoxidase